MVSVHFTANLQRHVQVPSLEVEGQTLAAVFQNMFAQYPRLQSYITDDQGHIRKHVMVFINGNAVNARDQLDQTIPQGCEIYIMQALSGG